MSVILGRTQADGYSYSDSLWSPSGTWSYEEAVENNDNTISARSYFEDGTMTENGVAQPNYVIKATPNRIGDTRLDDTPIEKSLTALRIYAERVDHISFLDFLVYTGVAFEDPRVVIDTVGAVDVTTRGVVGDGVTDNYIALQSIFEDLSVSRIYFPEGTYMIGSHTAGSYVGATFYDHLKLLYSDMKAKIICGPDVMLPIKPTSYLTQPEGGGAFDGLVIDGISFENGQFHSDPADNMYLHNVTIQNCKFEVVEGSSGWDVAQIGGISIRSKTQSGIVNFRVLNSSFINMPGGAIGVLNTAGGTPAVGGIVSNTVISSNYFYFNSAIVPIKPDWNLAISLAGTQEDPLCEHNTIDGYEWGIEHKHCVRGLTRYNNISNTLLHFSLERSVDCVVEYNRLYKGNINSSYEDNSIIRYNILDGMLVLTGSNGAHAYENHLTNDEDTNILIDGSKNTLVENNYCESSGYSSYAIQAYGINADDTNLTRNNRLYKEGYSSLTANIGDSTVIFENNNEIFVKEIPSLVLPKMFKGTI